MSAPIENGGPAFPHERVYLDSANDLLDAKCVKGGMSLRQYAAIALRVPNSGVEWLDEMIRESLRDQLAGQALMHVINASESRMEHCARSAYRLADIALAARKERP